MTALTRQDLRALRTATSVSFSFTPDKGHSITANLDADDQANTTGFDQHHRIEVVGRIQAHAGDSANINSCYGWWPSARFNDVASSILRLLREGDELALRWVASNDNDNLRRTGLTHDELFLTIGRTSKGTDRQQAWTFYADDSICPSNSTARMVRFN